MMALTTSDFDAEPRPVDVVLRDGSTLLLRRARAADEEELRALTGSDAPSFAPDRDDTIVLVGEAEGRLVGAASCRRCEDAPERADVSVAVAPDAQGHGIGTRLLESLAAAARTRGVRWFDADLPADRDQMMRVLLDSGFEVRRTSDRPDRVTLNLTETPAHASQAASRSQLAAAASVRPFFEPTAVALIGAGRKRGKIGSEILHNLVATGFTGRLAVVHPSASSIDGVTAYRRLADVPGDIDLAVISVPAAQVLPVVDDCIAKGVQAIVVISAGFSETNEEGRARERQLVEKVRRAGIRLVGPNCLGLLNTSATVRLNATFAPVFPPAGGVAMSTQSGALGLAILDFARRLGIGLSTFVSVGNKADISGNDLLQYWADDPHTRVILLYLESFGNPRKFSQIARRVARRKPIVAVKSGRSKVGARAATSHTGALVSNDAIVDALFEQCGVIRTNTMEELFDVAAVLANQPVPRGLRVAILSNAGGPGILAADACEARGLELPTLSDRCLAELRSFLPAAASVNNPVDMMAAAPPEHFERSLTAILADDRIDSVLVIFIPPLVTRGEDVARAVRRAAATTPDKPVVAVFMSSAPAGPMLAPIPSFAFPEAAAVALARASTYGRWRAEPEGDPPAFADIDLPAAMAIVQAVLARGGGWAANDEAFSLLRCAGIARPASELASSEDASTAAADRLGYPVVLKATGPAIVHKTELGAVQLNLEDRGAVAAAWRNLKMRLGDQMTGALVQPMIQGGVEMLIGSVDDAVFGPVVACALGGVLTEVLADSQFRLSPLTDRDARAMVEGLRGKVLLRGHRGRPAVDEAALREVLLRLSVLVDGCPAIREIEINPLVVLPSGVSALDVRARIEPPRTSPPDRRIQY